MPKELNTPIVKGSQIAKMFAWHPVLLMRSSFVCSTSLWETRAPNLKIDNKLHKHIEIDEFVMCH